MIVFKLMRSKMFFIVLGIWAMMILTVQKAQAQTFDMNTIIPDDQFIDYQSMTAATIQEFLNTQPGILASYVMPDGRTAAMVIYDAAQASHINPRVLLT